MTAATVRAALEPLANPADAQAMSTYMRNHFPFLGIKTPGRREATKELIRSWRGREPAEVCNLAEELWAQEEREFHYVACDLLRAYKGELGVSWLAALVTTNSWWDTVDALAKVVGKRASPRDMRAWSRTDNLWLRRVSVIHQLGFKEKTDPLLLTEMIDAANGTGEFFLNKAIGWALRDYARTEPEWVQRFVEQHDLAPLARREALKGLAGNRKA